MVKEATGLAEFFTKFGVYAALAILCLVAVALWLAARASDKRLIQELKETNRFVREMYEAHGRMSERFEKTAREMVDVVAKFTQMEKKAAPRRTPRGPARDEGREGAGRRAADPEEDESGNREAAGSEAPAQPVGGGVGPGPRPVEPSRRGNR
jgi:hypothetical protein